tara:strand:- start:107 stop:1183 length:1077 start_codon:yes stop_codon:yes gene_type:complete
MTKKKYNILTLGAAYGSLLGTKLILAGHDVTMVCLPEEVKLINAEGVRVKMPVRGRNNALEIDSRNALGAIRATDPSKVDPKDYDLIALAMQEPQYRSPGVLELLNSVAISRVPVVSIMNMPPPPYLKRISEIAAVDIDACYTDPAIWEDFDPAIFTMASPDPQAFRPPDEPANYLQVSLPTNFKVARFENERHTAILTQLEEDIMQIRFDPGDGETVELPVKLKVHDSVFVPLAKWAMLSAGNYRCVTPDGPRSIREAVHSDLDASRTMYEWVTAMCKKFGADDEDLVPFDKYAAAAEILVKPSSAARALFAGALNIERVDKLVQTLALSKGMQSDVLDRIVNLVDARLEQNRLKAS